MNGSGLIYAVIVVMWAVVLVPMWLRRHDEDAERSADRFSAAMRVLSRREAVEVDADEPGEPSVSPAAPHDADDEGAVVLPLTPEARVRMLARRRRTLAVLVGATLLTVVLAVAGVTPPVLVAGPGVLLALFLVSLRRAVLAEAQRPVVPAAAPEVAPEPAPAPVADRAPAETPAPSREPRAEESPAGAAREDDRGPAWQPVHIPPPTYVTKPAAPSPARTIDLSRPGFWTEGWEAHQAGEGESGEPAPSPAPPEQPWGEPGRESAHGTGYGRGSHSEEPPAPPRRRAVNE